MDISYDNRGVVIDETTFICSDLHIGYSNEVQIMTIQDERTEISDRVRAVLDKYELDNYIVAGDLFHSFQPADSNARELFTEMTSRIEVESEFTAICGNHDTATKSEYPNLVNFCSEYSISTDDTDIVVTHGHMMPEQPADLYIIGHLHPMVNINGTKWPTYLYGESVYEGADLLVLPTFTEYQDGIVVSETTKLNIDFPLVPETMFGKLRPIVYDDSADVTREFPVLSKSAKYFR